MSLWKEEKLLADEILKDVEYKKRRANTDYEANLAGHGGYSF